MSPRRRKEDIALKRHGNLVLSAFLVLVAAFSVTAFVQGQRSSDNTARIGQLERVDHALAVGLAAQTRLADRETCERVNVLRAHVNSDGLVLFRALRTIRGVFAEPSLIAHLSPEDRALRVRGVVTLTGEIRRLTASPLTDCAAVTGSGYRSPPPRPFTP